MPTSFVGKVLDNYRILERLGIGGMGVVFKAIHVKLEKIFAIKIIGSGLAMNEHFVKRFQTEAKSLAKFEDPNIVRIYDLRTADDQWFIVMEFVDGITLADKIIQDGAFHLKEALSILKQILSAMRHAHEAGIIHRDIKPNNIMLTSEGVVKITDFGLAKDLTNMTNTLTLTSGGTLFYMSPDHVKGSSFVDERSDLYSIGMTFYEMITGSVPFKNINSDFEIRETIMRKEFDTPISVNPDIPSELAAIVMKSISKEPENRYQTAEDMIQAIVDFEAHYVERDKDSIPIKSQNREKLEVSEDILKKSEDQPYTFTKGAPKRIKKYPVLKKSLAVLGMLLILVVVVKYFKDFSSKKGSFENPDTFLSLSVKSLPASALIVLNGDSVGRTPLQNYKLQGGQYVLSIVKEEYHSIDTTIILKNDSDLRLNFALQEHKTIKKPVQEEKKAVIKETKSVPDFAALFIRSDPRDSEIWVNGQLKGKTPLELSKMILGIYKIEIRNKTYETYEQQFELSAGNNQVIEAKLVPLTGALSISKEPPSATVFLDGEEIDTQNKRVFDLNNIPLGKHFVEIKKSGYSSFHADIIIKPNKIDTISAQILRLAGELTIQVRPWGSIYINDKLYKESADIKYQVSLPVDNYEVKVLHPTLGRWQRNVEVKADEKIDMVVNFLRKIPIKISALDAEKNPLAVEIYIDGKKTGKKTPDDIPVRIGMHKFAVKKDDYFIGDGEREIFVDEGNNKPLIFVLKKLD
jgi:serine/threonine protein kinase